jgi:hypothetical protein
MPNSGGGTFKVDDHQAARCEQAGRTAQHPRRIAANADIPVGEQHLVPATLGGQRREEIRSNRCSATLARQLDGSERIVDTERRVTAAVQSGGESARAAAQIQGGPSAALSKYMLVGQPIIGTGKPSAHPSVHRQFA